MVARKGDCSMDEKLLMLQLKKDNWEIIEAMDNWLYVFDKMPKKMRLVVDLKISGLTKIQIAKLCKCSLKNVEKHLRKAKKRFLRGENVI
jgi:DNA-directed RNA polymerase specialized sigma24 family protein